MEELARSVGESVKVVPNFGGLCADSEKVEQLGDLPVTVAQ
jgi:hypothetical protein